MLSMQFSRQSFGSKQTGPAFLLLSLRPEAHQTSHNKSMQLGEELATCLEAMWWFFMVASGVMAVHDDQRADPAAHSCAGVFWRSQML